MYRLDIVLSMLATTTSKDWQNVASKNDVSTLNVLKYIRDVNKVCASIMKDTHPHHNASSA